MSGTLSGPRDPGGTRSRGECPGPFRRAGCSTYRHWILERDFRGGMGRKRQGRQVAPACRRRSAEWKWTNNSRYRNPLWKQREVDRGACFTFFCLEEDRELRLVEVGPTIEVDVDAGVIAARSASSVFQNPRQSAGTIKRQRRVDNLIVRGRKSMGDVSIPIPGRNVCDGAAGCPPGRSMVGTTINTRPRRLTASPPDGWLNAAGMMNGR